MCLALRSCLAIFKSSVYNWRSSWNYQVDEPIGTHFFRVINFSKCFASPGGNYYPCPTAVKLVDPVAGLRLTVMTDRAQGCSSQGNGAVEVMVHRRCLKDDTQGVGEPLNETGLDGKGLRVRGLHRISLDPLVQGAAAHKVMCAWRNVTQYLMCRINVVCGPRSAR